MLHALEVCSLNHWTAREVPIQTFIKHLKQHHPRTEVANVFWKKPDRTFQALWAKWVLYIYLILP